MSERLTGIRLGDVGEVEVDPEDPDLLRVQLLLEPPPGPDWRTVFNRGPSGTGWPYDLGPAPRVTGTGTIELRTDEERLEKALARLREFVELTNRDIAELVIPQEEKELRAQEAARRTEEEREAGNARRVDAARQRLEDLLSDS